MLSISGTSVWNQMKMHKKVSPYVEYYRLVFEPNPTSGCAGNQ